MDTISQVAQVRKYGYIEQTTTYGLDFGGYSQSFFMLAEPTLVAINDVVAAAITTAGINWADRTITPTANLDFDEINARLDHELALTANSDKPNPRIIAGDSLTLASGWTLVVNAGITISEGNAIKKLIVPAITINETGAITGLYQLGTSPSARLQTTGLEACSLAVLDNTGAVYDFADNLTGTKTEYLAPGKTGTWTAIAERLGFKRQTTTFTPGLGGDASFAPIWVPDVSLLVTDAAVIAARDHAATPNQTLENACHWRTTAPGIKYDLVSKDGTSVVIGCDAHFVATASVPVAYDATANVLTIAAGAQHLPGSTLVAYRSPGKITIDAGVDFQCAYADMDGQRITVLGMDSYPLNVTWFMRYRIQGTTAWTTLSGTGNTKQLTLTEGIYEVEVRGDGYGWASGVIDTRKTLSLALTRVVALADDDTPQQLKPFNAALEAVFQFDPAAGAVAVTNTTGAPLSPGFGEVWRATQRIMNMPALVWTWDNPIKANALSQKIIIPDGNPITMYLTQSSNALVTITCPVVHESTGKSADDRVKGNAAGLYIKLGSQASAETAGLVDTIIARLGGPAFDTDTHGLSIVRAAITATKTVTDAVKAKTDNLPAQPAAVGDAMTLTAAYDSAKTAATQASVDAVKTKVDTLENADLSGLATAEQVTAIGSPLQAADYEAPANADIASIKTTVEAIEPTDLSGIPAAVRTELATELAHLDAKVSTRSTLKATDIPAGLTAAQVWTHADRTLTVASGLTPEQQQAMDELQTAVADLLKASDYTAPPNASDIAAQVELAIIKNGDGRALLQAIADKIGNENLSAATVAAAVWAASGRSLSSPSGLTDAQQQQLLQDVLTAIGKLPDASAAAAASVAAIMGEQVEVGATVRGSLQLLNAFAAGHIKGAGSSVEKFSNLAGTKDVIVSTNDGNGNRRTVNVDVDKGA